MVVNRHEGTRTVKQTISNTVHSLQYTVPTNQMLS